MQDIVLNNHNIALTNLLEKCNSTGDTIIFIDYMLEYGLIERADGTPYKILYDKDKNLWIQAGGRMCFPHIDFYKNL